MAVEAEEKISIELAVNACAGMDPNIFHPTLEVGRGKTADNQEQMNAALRVCAGCAVRQECGDIERVYNPDGLGGIRVYGGEVLGLTSRQKHLYKTTIDHLVEELAS